MASVDIRDFIRDVPDFPKKGIIFKDITTLLKDKNALRAAVDQMVACVKDEHIDLVVGIESRGFIFGTVIAYALGVGFAPVRKKGKLPAPTCSVTYELEYGTDTVEIHKDAITNGMKVLLVDDLLATGGTARGAIQLIENLGGSIAAFVCLIELDFLEARKKLKGYTIHSLIHY
jgi:adenine phosphoribosyltransferase